MAHSGHPHLTPVGAIIDMRFNCGGVAEWGIEAKSDGGTLQLLGEG